MALLCLLLSAAIAPLAISCSDDNNTPEEDESWREALVPYYAAFFKQPMSGGFSNHSFTFHISMVNSMRIDLLQSDSQSSVRHSDWYFEMDGKQYRLGDTIPTPAGYNLKPISVIGYMGYYKFFIDPVTINFDALKKAPLYLSMDFVWPSRNIRNHIDYYAEYNKNYWKEIEEFWKSDNDMGKILCGYYGLWIDSKTMEKDPNIFTLVID